MRNALGVVTIARGFLGISLKSASLSLLRVIDFPGPLLWPKSAPQKKINMREKKIGSPFIWAANIRELGGKVTADEVDRPGQRR